MHQILNQPQAASRSPTMQMPTMHQNLNQPQAAFFFHTMQMSTTHQSLNHPQPASPSLAVTPVNDTIRSSKAQFGDLRAKRVLDASICLCLSSRIPHSRSPYVAKLIKQITRNLTADLRPQSSCMDNALRAKIDPNATHYRAVDVDDVSWSETGIMTQATYKAKL